MLARATDSTRIGAIGTSESDTPDQTGLDVRQAGQAAFARRDWDAAFRKLTLAESREPLDPASLSSLATAAFLTGREEICLRTLERVHHRALDEGDAVLAVRAAFWLGLHLMLRGDAGPASGWLGRAQRLLDDFGKPCVEAGYLLLPLAERQLGTGDGAAAFETAERAARLGVRFADGDLTACARHIAGRALIEVGRVEDGLALLDEAMVAVAAGELSPIMTGLIYCSVIDACQRISALDRSREWTASLAGWCAAQPQLVAFTRSCLVHRAELMQVEGTWDRALEEAHRACAGEPGTQAPAEAFYQLAELHRLRGDFDAAEAAYREASTRGFEPQPGLALLRFANGEHEAALAAIRRLLASTTDPLERSRLLPAAVELTLEAGDVETARDAAPQLAEIADRYPTAVLQAAARQACGAVAIAEGEAGTALVALREALALWLQVAAPYQAARCRELMARCCRALGDADGAAMELATACETFRRLGARPDLARIERERAPEGRDRTAGLTPRELQVLRLVAAGKTNKAVAAELAISEKTVDRHVSNIFDKLDVANRTEAASWAHRHGLV